MSASFTASILKGFTTASIFFTAHTRTGSAKRKLARRD
jgi:hypothetical protein